MDRHDQKHSKEELEHELAEQLEHAKIEDGEALQKRANAQLSPKYEVRIQTEHDPIVEETARYRQLAKEVDGRYDDYVNRAAAAKKEQ